MKIGIVGAGHLGSTLARHFAKAGHLVALSNSRGPASLARLVESIGPSARAETVDGAAAFAELVVLAVPWRNPKALPSPARVAGKIVIDAMNAYSAEGEILDLGEKSSSEEVAQRLPGARLVKAFNTLYYHTLAVEARQSNQLVVFVAGDDADAKARVSRLIGDIGFAPLDTGSLRDGGRKQQPGSAIYNRPMTISEARAALGLLQAGEAP